MKTKQQYLLCIAFIILSAGCIKSEENLFGSETSVKGINTTTEPINANQ